MIRNPLILKLVFRIKPDVVYHIGAHHGQDGPQYKKLGAKKICWGEATAASAEIIAQKYPSDIIINKIFWKSSGENITFYESDKPENNSTYAFKSEREKELNVRSNFGLTTTVDETVNLYGLSKKSLLVLDVQGAEFEVLLGSTQTLKIIRNLIIEITSQNTLYKEMSKESDLVLLLAKNNLYPSIKRISHDYSYYDQLFTKQRIVFRLFSKFIDSLINYFIQTLKFCGGRSSSKYPLIWH
jgi:FkbM family methyltransferase